MNRPPQLIVGAKLPLRPMHVWALRVRLQIVCNGWKADWRLFRFPNAHELLNEDSASAVAKVLWRVPMKADAADQLDGERSPWWLGIAPASYLPGFSVQLLTGSCETLQRSSIIRGQDVSSRSSALFKPAVLEVAEPSAGQL